MTRRPLFSIVAGVLLVLGLAASVLAHAELVSSDPADGATLTTPPTAIALTFSESLDAAKSSFKLLGSGGSTVGTGEVTGDVVMALDGLTLAAGDYEIQWTSASAADGDIDRGTLGFTVLEPTPSPSGTASPGGTAPPASATPSASVTPSFAPSPTASAVPVSAPLTAAAGDVLLPIVVALVLVAGVGLLVLRRSRRA